jgi:uncharacterized membrane protein
MNWGRRRKERIGSYDSGNTIALEGIGALWIVVGVIAAMVKLISVRADFRHTNFTPVRLMFSRYLSLALEFQLASDILSTSISRLGTRSANSPLQP